MLLLAYARGQIKNDQTGSHDFRRFLRQFSTDCLEILQMPFSIKILTGVKIFSEIVGLL